LARDLDPLPVVLELDVDARAVMKLSSGEGVGLALRPGWLFVTGDRPVC
jgi:hypothetical protein